MLQTFDPLTPLAVIIRRIHVQVFNALDQDMTQVTTWWHTAVDEFDNLTPAEMLLAFRFDDLQAYVETNFN